MGNRALVARMSFLSEKNPYGVYRRYTHERGVNRSVNETPKWNLNPGKIILPPGVTYDDTPDSDEEAETYGDVTPLKPSIDTGSIKRFVSPVNTSTKDLKISEPTDTPVPQALEPTKPSPIIKLVIVSSPSQAIIPPQGRPNLPVSCPDQMLVSRVATIPEHQFYTTRDLTSVETYYQKFMKARIDMSDCSCKVPTKDFYAEYDKWVVSYKTPKMGKVQHGVRLKKYGIVSKESHSIRYYLGIRIRNSS